MGLKARLVQVGFVLAVGALFPYDFGFVPSTLADDGDPIDVLLLMEEPAFVGCLVPSRLISGFFAMQTESGKAVQNDRLLAVAAKSRNYYDVRSQGRLKPELNTRDRTLFCVVQRC